MDRRGIEIERKFRLRQAPDEAALAAHGAVAQRIEQVYLRPDPGASGPDAPDVARVRRTELPDGTVAFRRTTKRRVGAFSFDEAEDAIDAIAWVTAMANADPTRRAVRKTRHVVESGPHTLEIDVFEVPAGLVVVEVELASEDDPVVLPAWLGEWREVTGDERYFNVSLARRDAVVPPFGGPVA
jgi:CYTH domain-containing protein